MFCEDFRFLSLPARFQSNTLSVAAQVLIPFEFSKRVDAHALRTFLTIHLFQFFLF
jgi:hypothetical protein